MVSLKVKYKLSTQNCYFQRDYFVSWKTERLPKTKKKSN